MSYWNAVTLAVVVLTVVGGLAGPVAAGPGDHGPSADPNGQPEAHGGGCVDPDGRPTASAGPIIDPDG